MREPYKVYGESDKDLTAENLLRETVKDSEVRYLILHQRMPLNARPCKLPGSLTVQAMLSNGCVVTVRQNKPAGEARVIEGSP